MKQRDRIAIAIAIAGASVLLFYPLVSHHLFYDCGISETSAREMVLGHLQSKDPSPEASLKLENSSGSCEFSYSYKGPAGDLSLVVIMDDTRGPKLTLWDYEAERKELAERAEPS